MVEKACVTSKGQLVIPVSIRRRYGIKPGTRICFIERNHEILFQPVTREYIRSVHGVLKSETLVTQELLQERAKDRAREEAGLEKLGT
ncbi:MAG: AbrB/MazE/SpoVT family DNA-binding domain-containing protein [Armatimonadetes bacterium]|nr:AbrB/MazE/SpoVT family DNA-binding domain-containing protein [Armatimonadota bacterium]